MKYLVTCVMTDAAGHQHFDPVVDTEIYDTYWQALRYLVNEKRWVLDMGGGYHREYPTYRTEFGRQRMLDLCIRLHGNFYRYTISRININGFH